MYPTLKNQTINILKRHRGRRLYWMDIYKMLLEQNPGQTINPASIDRLLRNLTKDSVLGLKRDFKGNWWLQLEDDKSAKLTDFFKGEER